MRGQNDFSNSIILTRFQVEKIIEIHKPKGQVRNHGHAILKFSFQSNHVQELKKTCFVFYPYVKIYTD